MVADEPGTSEELVPASEELPHTGDSRVMFAVATGMVAVVAAVAAVSARARYRPSRRLR